MYMQIYVNIFSRSTQVHVQIFPHNSKTRKQQGKKDFLFSKTCTAHVNPVHTFTHYACLSTPI
jgi:hypothetical protein